MGIWDMNFGVLFFFGWLIMNTKLAGASIDGVGWWIVSLSFRW